MAGYGAVRYGIIGGYFYKLFTKSDVNIFYPENLCYSFW